MRPAAPSVRRGGELARAGGGGRAGLAGHPGVHSAGGPRARPPAPQNTAARRHGKASAVQAASDTSTDDLAALIASRETELARLFEPGKPQPRAATVAALRKDIANLRGRLNAGLGVERPQLGSSVTSPTAATPSSILSVPGPASPSAIASSGRVLNALKLVEAQLAVSRQADTVAITDLSLEQQQLLLRLQDDNVALKAKLDVVLARQAQLQWLVEQHVGSTAAGTGGSNSSKAIEWDTPAAVAAAEPHAMHTAAC